MRKIQNIHFKLCALQRAGFSADEIAQQLNKTTVAIYNLSRSRECREVRQFYDDFTRTIFETELVGLLAIANARLRDLVVSKNENVALRALYLLYQVSGRLAEPPELKDDQKELEKLTKLLSERPMENVSPGEVECRFRHLDSGEKDRIDGEKEERSELGKRMVREGLLN